MTNEYFETYTIADMKNLEAQGYTFVIEDGKITEVYLDNMRIA